MRIYNDLDIRCKYYDQCKTVLKIADLEDHEKVCQIPKCENFEICGNRSKKVILGFSFMSKNWYCYFLSIGKKKFKQHEYNERLAKNSIKEGY